MPGDWRTLLTAWSGSPQDLGARRRLRARAVAPVDATATREEALAMARALLALGRPENAASWCRHALDSDGDSEAPLLMGECLVAQGHFDEAHRWFLDAARLSQPGRPGRALRARALGRAAHCLAEIGAPRDAVPLFEEALDLLKHTPMPDRTAWRTRMHVRAAACYAELGAAHQARRHYEQAADRAEACLTGQLEPSEAVDCLLGAAEHALRGGEVEQARGQFDRARRLVVQLPAGRLGGVRRARMETGLGLCDVEQGRWVSAAAHFRVAVRGLRTAHRESETYASALLNLAEAEARAGRAHIARRAFDEAIGRRVALRLETPAALSETALAHQLFATFLLEQGDAAAAELQYRAAVEAWRRLPDPDRVDARLLSLSEHQLGACLALRGETGRAVDHFRAAVAAARRGDNRGEVDPASLAVSLMQLGTALLSEGEPAPALAAFQEAQTLWTSAHHFPDGLDHEAVGAALHGRGACHLMLGQPDEATALLHRAAEAKARGDATGRVDRGSLGSTWLLLGQTQYARGRHEESLRAFDEATVSLRQAHEAGAPVTAPLALALHSAASIRSGVGELRAALAAYTEAARLKGWQSPGCAAPDVEHLSVTLHELAGCHLGLGDTAEARRYYLEAAAVAGRGDEQGRVDHDSVGTSLHQVGHCFTLEDDAESARLFFERAVEEKRLGDREGRVSAASLGTSFQAVGYCLLDAGRRAEALMWFRRALNEKRQGDASGRVDQAAIGSALHQIAFTLAAEGRLDEAVEEFQRAAEAKSRGDLYGRVDHESVGATWHLLGDCLLEQGQPEEALAWYVRAVEAAQQGDVHGRVDHESLGLSQHQAGFAAFACDRTEEAEEWLRKAAAAKLQGNLQGAVDHDSLGTTWHELAFCAVRAENYESAREAFFQAAAAKSLGNLHGVVDHAAVARCLLRAAECEGASELYWDARMTLERALKSAREAEQVRPGSSSVSELIDEIDRARKRNRRALTGGG